jgi:hypothetical protein
MIDSSCSQILEKTMFYQLKNKQLLSEIKYNLEKSNIKVISAYITADPKNNLFIISKLDDLYHPFENLNKDLVLYQKVLSFEDIDMSSNLLVGVISEDRLNIDDLDYTILLQTSNKKQFENFPFELYIDHFVSYFYESYGLIHVTHS